MGIVWPVYLSWSGPLSEPTKNYAEAIGNLERAYDAALPHMRKINAERVTRLMPGSSHCKSPATRGSPDGRRVATARAGSFPDDRSAVSDALTYCDLTTEAAGEPVSVAERLGEIERRYGRASLVVRALEQASETLLAMVERTEQRLSHRPDSGFIAAR
jgi:hypothetical protein